jgi:hemin uptake protein HemP
MSTQSSADLAPEVITAAAPAINAPPKTLPFAEVAKQAITSRALLGKGGVCVIVHNDERYVLRRTRNDKLILTK